MNNLDSFVEVATHSIKLAKHNGLDWVCMDNIDSFALTPKEFKRGIRKAFKRSNALYANAEFGGNNDALLFTNLSV